jgi:hypothetical protein
MVHHPESEGFSGVLTTETLLQTSPPQGLVGCCTPTPQSSS